MCLPDINIVVLRASDDILSITTERGLDLTACVQVTFVLAG